MFRSLLLALTLAASASAGVVVRMYAARPLDISGKTFSRVGKSRNAQCAKQVQYGDVTRANLPKIGGATVGGAINFDQITAWFDKDKSKHQCGGDRASGAMLLFSQNEFSRLKGTTRLDKQERLETLLVGGDTERRRCGKFVDKHRSTYTFMNDSRVFRERFDRAGIEIPAKYRGPGLWMLQSFPGDNGMCAYVELSAIAGRNGTSEVVGLEGGTSENGTSTGVASGSGEFENNTLPSPRCFPGTATVDLQGGFIKLMADVKIGDRVKVADGVFSHVFMFSHRMTDTTNDFVVVKTVAGTELPLTDGHFLYVNGALAAAKTIRAGDVVESASGAPLTVASVASRSMQGLYNPQTVHGDIVVNGIRASTFTTAVQPSAAHALLAPMRAIYVKLGISTAALNQGADKLARAITRMSE